MKTPAGDMEITILGMDAEDEQLVATGQLGAWNATIYFNSDDILDMVRLMLDRRVISLILKLPFILIKKMLLGKERQLDGRGPEKGGRRHDLKGQW